MQRPGGGHLVSEAVKAVHCGLSLEQGWGRDGQGKARGKEEAGEEGRLGPTLRDLFCPAMEFGLCLGQWKALKNFNQGVRNQMLLWLQCGQRGGKGRTHSRCFTGVSFSLGPPFLWKFMKH